MVSPYLDRPLRSVAEAEAERRRREGDEHREGHAQDPAGTGAAGRDRPSGGFLLRLGHASAGRGRPPLPVIAEDDYG